MKVSAYLRRKVDQQLSLCSDLRQLAAGPATRVALRNALCWQLEHTLCFYLLELARAAGNRHWRHPWTLDADVLEAALQALPGADTQELAALAREHDSWLALLLGGLSSLRRVEEAPALKAQLLQSDVTASQPGMPLIATSSAGVPRVPEWEELSQITLALHGLIERQRLGHEEY